MKLQELTNKESFEKFCAENFPEKAIKWHTDYCFVQAGTNWGTWLHYEFHKGYVHLHIEGSNWKGICNYLKKCAPFQGIEPKPWGRNDCDWKLNKEICCEKDLYDAFLHIRDILEPVIDDFETDSFPNLMPIITKEKISAKILTVYSLLQEQLRIPHYQRPYRWEEKNVEQLMSDILDNWSEHKSRYRIGSVILHKNGNYFDIVDGQQRITTILLILEAFKYIFSPDDNRNASLSGNLKFRQGSFKHIKENFYFIEDWIKENLSEEDYESYLNYLLNKCEFVEVAVTELSEAFQMFESQNGRGKELESYNLLKAYHIRAMEQNSQEEKIKCDRRWEESTRYDADNIDVLKQIFNEQLYRSRKWSRKEQAGKFSKKEIDEFKGFTIDKNHPTVFPYQNPQLLQYLTAKFYSNVLEGTVTTCNRFQYGDTENINPFVNINQTIVNGKPFFDYVETYVELYKQLFINIGTYQLSDFKKFYYAYCLHYECEWDDAERLRKESYAHYPKGGARRTGDGYLRELYKSLILVLFDKFGESGLNKYYQILYRLVYMTRLANEQVRYSTVDKLPIEELGNCFSVISQAKALSDLRILERIMRNKCSKLDIRYTMKGAERVTNFILKGHEDGNDKLK